jgi:hypothetical protein
MDKKVRHNAEHTWKGATAAAVAVVQHAKLTPPSPIPSLSHKTMEMMAKLPEPVQNFLMEVGMKGGGKAYWRGGGHQFHPFRTLHFLLRFTPLSNSIDIPY